MSSSTPTLLIFGAGGHARVVADAALAQGAWTGLQATADDITGPGAELLPRVPLVAPQDGLGGAQLLHIAIGSAAVRERKSMEAALPLATIVHPRAAVSPHASLRPGCFVAAQAVVAPGAQVGSSVIVNHGAVVDHDVQVGDFSHIAPGATLGGEACIGRRVLVGAGARVLPGVRVADDVIIGAGAVVHEDITGPGTFAGVPVRRIS